MASLKVPEKAAKEFRKARKAARRKKYDEALGRLQKATEMYPQYAAAFNEMGLIYLRQNQQPEARQAFQQAIAADPDWVRSYVNLAALQMREPQQLLETSNKILQLYPTLSPGHFFHSYANLSLGRVEEAEKSALQADQHDHRQVPQIHLLLAQIYWQKESWRKRKSNCAPFCKRAPRRPTPIKSGPESRSYSRPKRNAGSPGNNGLYWIRFLRVFPWYRVQPCSQGQ